MEGKGKPPLYIPSMKNQVKTQSSFKKDHILIGTWNVRTLYKDGRIENVMKEMKRMKISILGLCETRHTGAGDFLFEKHNIIYSGGSKHERGVGIILDETKARSLIGYQAISDRVLLVKLKSKPLYINFIQVYAPTADSTESSIELFYEEINLAMKEAM